MYGNKTYNDRYAVWHTIYKSTNIKLGGGTAWGTFSNVWQSNNGIYGSPSRGTGISSIPMDRGRYYWEITVLQRGDSNAEHFGLISPYNFTFSNVNGYYQNSILGLTDSSTHPHSSLGIRNGGYACTLYYENNWLALNGFGNTFIFGTYSMLVGDVFSFELDVTGASVSVRRNGTNLVSFNPSISGGLLALTSSSGSWHAACASDGSTTTASVYWANFGQKPFSYPVPSGYIGGIYNPTYAILDRRRVYPTPTITLEDHSLKAVISKTLMAGAALILGNMGKSVGKWYWEVDIIGGSVSKPFVIGIAYSSVVAGVYPSYTNPNVWFWGWTGIKTGFGANAVYGTGGPSLGDNVGVALDMDAGSITMYKNGVNQGVMFTGLTAGATGPFYPYASNFITTSPTQDGPTYLFNFGQRPFKYAVPSGFNYGLYI